MDNNTNNKLLKNILKSALYTALIWVISMYGIYSIANLAFPNMSGEQSNTWVVLSFCIGIIFTIFYCTFTIIDEIKNVK
ncbi:hypothetical protein JK636_00475 [Clostridium sp. YIM B02515]|uniref:DUF997 family protein n=1 Tax=Clostridium rhizosphaerae TaxID=2803861 RepID=A0ABS1T4H4_9CLOT|nr:hypothetical protein [Clostridium rhizosphaerae]MBL4934225.1 hypothetical protein [Clostridium rhizosphaerae]